MDEHNAIDRMEKEVRDLDVDGIVRNAFARTASQGSAVDVDALTRSKATVSTPNESALRRPRSRPTLISVALTVCVFFAVVLLPFWGDRKDSNNGTVLGQMQDQIEKLRSVQYKGVETHPGSRSGETYRCRVYILGEHLRRVEEEVSLTSIHSLVDRLRTGLGIPTEGIRSVTITNQRTGKRVTLFPDEKRFVEPKTPLKPSHIDFYERIRAIPPDATNNLGEATIAGKKVVGFGFQKRDDEWIRTEEYWVETATRLPVRIEGSTKPVDPDDGRRGSTRWVLSDFAFNQPLDESLFSTEPPEGFSVERE